MALTTALDLPPIFLLPTHLDPATLHGLESKIPSLTYDINEAEIVLGNITKPERAQFELRHRKVVTEPVRTAPDTSSPGSKRRKLSPTTYSSPATDGTGGDNDSSHELPLSAEGPDQEPDREPHRKKASHDAQTIKVVRLAWLTDSFDNGSLLPLTHYVLYEANGQVQDKGAGITTQRNPGRASRRGLRLVRQSTSEQEADHTLPPIPDFLHTTYSCERPTPVNPLNSRFIEELKKIRTTRLLIGDQIGVRAYSTAIATLSAYPYEAKSGGGKYQIARLPGCGAKIAELYQEWATAGSLREASDAEADPKLSVLRVFYDIWGVGDTTARHFYSKGWRNLDDLVEYAWDDQLNRVQQIGVKYYDDFKLKIPRPEVESIAETILAHARVFNSEYQMTIVGGYRRGKRESGDVDVILSHPDEAETLHLVEKLVLSLEEAKFITHTLTISSKNSERGQAPVKWKGNDSKGSGFDTLDKALVVWQDPRGDGDEAERPHRRVDIIISPWKTVGCAVLGWSGETTFQRDIRRYCKRQKKLKFDSSGVRSRVDGTWVDLEGGGLGRAPDMITAEKRVFRGLGLDWRPPEERCTG